MLRAGTFLNVPKFELILSKGISIPSKGITGSGLSKICLLVFNAVSVSSVFAMAEFDIIDPGKYFPTTSKVSLGPKRSVHAWIVLCFACYMRKGKIDQYRQFLFAEVLNDTSGYVSYS